MARQEGPIKGLGVLVCDEIAESSSLVVEPVHLTKIEYDAVLAGTQTLEANVIVDQLGHPYIELTMPSS
jgi:hypothetical protein